MSPDQPADAPPTLYYATPPLPGSPSAWPASAGLSRRSLLVVLSAAAAFLLPALGGRFRVLTQHEVFAAEPAREMLSGGHWVIPQFAGKPRTVKPPATGWLIAGSMALFQSRDEWAVRLPAALAGVATAGLVAWLAGRWLGDAGGLVAGLMQATVGYTLMQARLAEADMLMCAAVALAMAAFAAGAVDADRTAPGTANVDPDDRPLKSRDREGAGQSNSAQRAKGPQDRASSELPADGAGGAHERTTATATSVATGPTAGPADRLAIGRNPTAPLPDGRGSLNAVAVLFHLGLGLSFLFKGVGIAFALAGCLLWVAVTRRWRPAARLLLHPVGLSLLAVLVVSWPLAAWRQMPGILDVWYRETFLRAGGQFGDDPWYVYLWSAPLLLLPWLPFAVRGGVALWRRHGRRDARLAFLACWFAAGMVLLHVSAAKSKHYAIPMLPPVTVLAAAGFVDWLAGGPRRRAAAADEGPGGETGRRRSWLVPAAAVVACGTIAVVAVSLSAKAAPVEMAVTVAAVAVGVAATAGLYAAGRRRAVVAACFGTALVGGLAFQGLILPRFDDYRASADLGRRATAAVPAADPVYLLALGEAHVAFYVDRPLVRVDKRAEFPAFVARLTAEGTAATPDAPGSGAARVAYALCPASAVADLRAVADVAELDRVDHLRRAERDPTVFVRVVPRAAAPPSP